MNTTSDDIVSIIQKEMTVDIFANLYYKLFTLSFCVYLWIQFKMDFNGKSSSEGTAEDAEVPNGEDNNENNTTNDDIISNQDEDKNTIHIFANMVSSHCKKVRMWKTICASIPILNKKS